MAILVMSGATSVTTPGSAIPFTTLSTIGGGTFLIKAHPSNTSLVYIGNDGTGDVTSSNGMALAASETALITVSALTQVYMDATTTSQIASWFRMEGENVGRAAPAA